MSTTTKGSDLLSHVKTLVDEANDDFSKVERIIDKLTAQPLSVTAANLGPVERARLFALYAFYFNSLSSRKFVPPIFIGEVKLRNT